MKYVLMLFLLSLGATGCRGRAELSKALSDAKAAEAQKDSLLSEVLETTQFVSDINSELAKAKFAVLGSDGADRGVPGAQQDREDRKAALDRIRLVIGRLNQSESRLTAAEGRLRTAKSQNSKLMAQIAAYKQTIADLKSAAEQQEAMIAEQRTQIATLAGRVDTLTQEKGALVENVAQLTAYKNRVYYAIGTKDELLRNGVVTKEGSKFLFFGGTRLEPARQPNLDAFTLIDKTQTLSIPLPRADKKYKIVSRQNPEYLTGDVTQKGEVRGVLEIASPEEFWSASKFLIVVQD
jgi:hypothetical protein